MPPSKRLRVGPDDLCGMQSDCLQAKGPSAVGDYLRWEAAPLEAHEVRLGQEWTILRGPGHGAPC